MNEARNKNGLLMDFPVKTPIRKGSARRKSPRAIRSPYTTEACQECRRRRAKCDGTKPSCGRCLRHGIDCKFTGRDDSRGTAPKSLVMLLQSRIDLLEQVLWLHSIDVDATIAQLRARGDFGSGTSLPAQPSPQITEPDGALCSKGSFGVGDDGEVSYFGSSSGRVELLHSNAADTDHVAPTSLPPVGSRLNQFCQEIQSGCDISEDLKEHLIAIYFEWEQPWCQLVDESLFRESMQSKGRYFSPLLLNSILAIGSRYSDRPEVRSVRDDPNTAGQAFLEIAEVLLHFDLQSPSITTIQSLGILAIMYVATGSDSKGWLKHGMAVRLALDMGLNLNSATLHKSHVFSEVEIELRKQIYWALFCTDKMWASYTGRVCTMLDSQALVQLPLPSGTGQEPTSPREALRSLHHALSTQCQILEKILTSLYAPKSLSPGVQRHTFFDQCLLELKSWKYRLPVELQIKLSAGSDARTHTHTRPYTFILHMVYHTSLIMLTKPFLARKQRPSRETPSTGGLSKDQGQDQSDPTAERAMTLCMDAAREISLLGEQYRKAFGSFRQTPVTATHCTLSAVLFFIFSLNNCVSNEMDDGGEARSQKAIAKAINSCVVTLGELASSWSPARRYWKAVLAILEHRHVRSKADSSSQPASSTPGCSAAAPDADLEGISGSFWDSVLGGENYAGSFHDVGMWQGTANYDSLGAEGETLFDGLMLGFPYGFEPFPGFSPEQHEL
ncbi:uncharacterized protein N7446_001191 [Penicillium canescens]|uniref:Zn(2)-C6 fungal-type domain-containing protein n=1 Tax=Penicillium canescens TaxID=5083 RepID=A0AAD6IBL9_PENCN|nr:uncharacterized protein N7446_001191 [Penicillium canescens]KAJ6042995.1 hypothetical protein N7460_004350 [Penicillium canescens]KAJ6054468.1 hypothetical protein N7444_003566 [Penicillium canescens]KAJ6073414.1 hypothetical protein N7446_001191 [Penicillium canescens]